MKNLLDRMSSTRCIVISFLLMVACGASFGYYTDAVGGRLLDETWNQQAALGVLSAMSSEQQNTHFWVTVSARYALPGLLRHVLHWRNLAAGGQQQ